jgi:hypothetical protein
MDIMPRMPEWGIWIDWRQTRVIALPWSVLVALALGVGGTAQGGTSPALTFQVLSQTVVPTELKAAMDVRWASGDSLYFALGGKGVVQAALAIGSGPDRGPSIKEVIPGKTKPGGLWLTYHVAASSDYLVAAPPAFELAWRRLSDPALVEEPFEYIHGIDVRGGQLAVVGLRSDQKRNFSPDGAIAWVGSLDQGLTDLRPIVFSATGPGASGILSCGSFGLGAVRFLADGTLLVVAGVQPGASLFSATGQLIRTWDTTALGIDTDCGSLTNGQAAKLGVDYRQRVAWLDRRRTVDAILPLQQGAGLVIRTVENHITRWDLRILHPDGTWATLPLPLRGVSTWSHLRGDVRDGKLVLLLYEDSGMGRPDFAQPQVITAVIN